MQELAAGLRQAGLKFSGIAAGCSSSRRFERGVFGHESAGVSASINAILEKVSADAGHQPQAIGRTTGARWRREPADSNARRLTLASDLHWLISEGYVIEFNDGSLDLPRTETARGARG